MNFIFDVEGTLIDCVPQVLNCWTVVLANWGLAIPPELLALNSGKDPNDMLEELLPYLPAKERKALIEQHGEEYRAAFLPSTFAFPAVRELLVEVKGQGHRIGLATTCDETVLQHYRRLMAAEDLIDAVVCGDDVQHGKPHPDLLNLILKLLGAGRAVAVGDTPYDAIAARAAGVDSIGLTAGGFSEAALREAGCSEVFALPRDLLEALRAGQGLGSWLPKEASLRRPPSSNASSRP